MVEGWGRVSGHGQLCVRGGGRGRTEPLYPLSSRYLSIDSTDRIVSRDSVLDMIDHVLCIASKHAGRYVYEIERGVVQYSVNTTIYLPDIISGSRRVCPLICLARNATRCAEQDMICMCMIL